MNVITILLSILAGAVFYFFGLTNPGKRKGLHVTGVVPEKVVRWKETAEKYAREYGINPVDVMAILWTESAGFQSAKGSAGELGLMQLKEIAVKDVQSNYPDDDFSGWRESPEKNIKAGTAFLALQIKRAGSVDEGIKAYNQGLTGSKIYPERAQKYLNLVDERRKNFDYA